MEAPRLTVSDQGFLSTVSLVETYWVFRRAYKVDRGSTADVLQGRLESQEITVESPDTVRRALRRVSRGAEFPDAMIAESGHRAGCGHTVTFDRNAAKSAGMLLLP